MIVQIADGSSQNVYPGSMVTMDPSVQSDTGPFPVNSVDPRSGMLVVDDNPNPIPPSIVVRVDNTSVPQQLITFNIDGAQALLFPDALIEFQKAQIAFGGAIFQLQALMADPTFQGLRSQVTQLQNQVAALQSQIAEAVSILPNGSGDQLNKLALILNPTAQFTSDQQTIADLSNQLNAMTQQDQQDTAKWQTFAGALTQEKSLGERMILLAAMLQSSIAQSNASQVTALLNELQSDIIQATYVPDNALGAPAPNVSMYMGTTLFEQFNTWLDGQSLPDIESLDGNGVAVLTYDQYGQWQQFLQQNGV